MNATTLAGDLTAKLAELRQWFAAKPEGWEKRATPEMIRQWEDRKREEKHLIKRLELLEVA